MTDQPPSFTVDSLSAAIASAVGHLAPIATRLVCAPDVVCALRFFAAPVEPPAAWQPSPLAAPTDLPVVVDDDLPAGVWRMLNAEGGIVREGTLEPLNP